MVVKKTIDYFTTFEAGNWNIMSIISSLEATGYFAFYRQITPDYAHISSSTTQMGISTE